jgi:hypothetical protein
MQLLEQGATSSGSLPPIRTVMQSADARGFIKFADALGLEETDRTVGVSFSRES